jgi:hypothetical protein
MLAPGTGVFHKLEILDYFLLVARVAQWRILPM